MHHHLARIRWLLARYPWIYWATVTFVAVLIGVRVDAAMNRVDAARRAWGATTDVWVAVGDIQPGEEIRARHRPTPTAMTPKDAAVHDPSGSTARQRVTDGEIITTSDVSAAGAAGLIPDGWVAVAVSASAGHFEVGDSVAVFAAGQRIGAGLVVAVGDDDATVAVPEESAGALAAATLDGTVTLALTRPPATTP